MHKSTQKTDIKKTQNRNTHSDAHTVRKQNRKQAQNAHKTHGQKHTQETQTHIHTTITQNTHKQTNKYTKTNGLPRFSTDTEMEGEELLASSVNPPNPPANN